MCFEKGYFSLDGLGNVFLCRQTAFIRNHRPRLWLLFHLAVELVWQNVSKDCSGLCCICFLCCIFSVHSREMLLCACGTGTSLQETKLRTARLITFRPTHPVRSEGSTKQTAVCFTMRQNATVSGLVNGAGRSREELSGFLSPRGQP